MPRHFRAFSYARERPGPFSGEQGASAITLVLGVMMVMLLLAATVVGQIRQDLRMSRAEALSDQVRLLILGTFNEAAVLAEDPGWAGSDSIGCTPSAGYPNVCMDYLHRRPVEAFDGMTYEQIPIRVVARAGPTSESHLVYGWILIDELGTVTVKQFHRWCPPPAFGEYLTWGPCRQGG